MAWSYTKASGDSGFISGGTQISWVNSWTLAELEPDPIGSIRLRLTVSTSSYWSYPATYVGYCTDKISCGGESVTVTPRQTAGRSYTRTVHLPNAWAGQTVSLDIAWTRVSVTLGARPSYSEPTELQVGDGVFGEAVPILLLPGVNGARSRLTVQCAGLEETLLDDGEDTALSWTPSLARYAAALPAADSAPALFTCESFYDGQSLGTRTREITLRLPASVDPVVGAGWFTLTPYNAGGRAAAIEGVYVQGHSRAEAVFDAGAVTFAYGAALRGFSLRCGGETVSAAPYRSGVLAGETQLTLTVEDSRGRTASETLTVTPEPYYSPRLTAAAIYRSDAAGAALESGAYYTGRGSVDIAPLAGQNAAELRLSLRSPGGAWSEGALVTPGASLTLGEISPDRSYEARLLLTDRLGGTAEHSAAIPTRHWAMKFGAGGTAVAFGKAPEHDKCLELPGDWSLRRGEQRLDQLAVGDVFLTARAGSPAALLGYGEWEAAEASLPGLALWIRTA